MWIATEIAEYVFGDFYSTSQVDLMPLRGCCVMVQDNMKSHYGDSLIYDILVGLIYI